MPTEVCPFNDWWPDFMEDWGEVKAVAGGMDPWSQFWNEGNTWCFYDSADNLTGRFVEDPAGETEVTFNGTDGNGSYSGGVYGFSGGDSDGFSYTVKLRRID